ncbi:MAG: hypothetical protein JWP80_964 [Pseudomonas sp.]|nr:hypothetical protein [Pseudomonas sp.]
MICNYDLAVLKRETRNLKTIVNRLKQQAIVLLQHDHIDLAVHTMKKAELIEAVIEKIEKIDE